MLIRLSYDEKKCNVTVKMIRTGINIRDEFQIIRSINSRAIADLYSSLFSRSGKREQTFEESFDAYRALFCTESTFAQQSTGVNGVTPLCSCCSTSSYMECLV